MNKFGPNLASLQYANFWEQDSKTNLGSQDICIGTEIDNFCHEQLLMNVPLVAFIARHVQQIC